MVGGEPIKCSYVHTHVSLIQYLSIAEYERRQYQYQTTFTHTHPHTHARDNRQQKHTTQK